MTVEGVAVGRTSATTNGPFWDGVDCALYFGGVNLASAISVEFIQLKYSTDPTAPWTIARLTCNSAKKGNNSVMRRFAQEFARARAQMSPGAQLRLQFLSNQPVALADVAMLKSLASGKAVPPDQQEDLKKLEESTGLRRNDLADLLAVLDMSGCGVDSRFAHRESVILAVAKLIEDNATSEVAELHLRVRELMLPERKGEIILDKTVLSWFGIADRSGLFPCPQETITVERPVLRDCAREAARLLQAGSRLVCIHGPGACGKTTAAKQLSAFLPPGSRSVLFDCYGGGRYLFSDDRRHLPQNAFLEIVNDLAMELRAPLLVPRDSRQVIDVGVFLKRTSEMGDILSGSEPAALLTIVIDAADNSVAAATKVSPQEACFIHEMCGADLAGLPPNVRFVVSCRTSRLNDLRLPSYAARVECPPFSPLETQQHARAIWPDATSEWIALFHGLSNGVPRLQAYAVKAASGDQAKALAVLQPGGKGLGQVLREQFEQATRKAGDPGLLDSLLTALAVLPVPVPPRCLAEVAGTTEAVIGDIVNDLLPGLRPSPDGVVVADEDFEAFIHSEAKANLGAARAKAAELLLRDRLTDPYAATHLADALVAAQQGERLLHVLESDQEPRAIVDPIVRREVVLRRLRLALSACRSTSSTVDAAKVIIISADANKDEAALRKVLEEETDLAVHFAWPTLRRLVLSDRDRACHQGSVLAQDARRAARSGDRLTTRERLISHDAWLEQRRAVPKEQWPRWKLSDEDIAARTEAIFELAGPRRAIRELRRWMPRETPLRAALRVVPALIESGRHEALMQVLKDRLVPEPWTLLIAIPLAVAGCEIRAEVVQRSLKRIRRAHVPRLPPLESGFGGYGWSIQLFDTYITACELAVHLGVESTMVLRALDVLARSQRAPREPVGPVTFDAALRIWFLKRRLEGKDATSDGFLNFLSPAAADEGKPGAPPKQAARPANADPRADDLGAALAALFPIYAARVNLIARKTQSPPASDTDQLQNMTIAPHEYRLGQSLWSREFRAEAAASVMRLMALPHVPPTGLFERALRIAKGSFEDTFGFYSAPLLRSLLLRKSSHHLVLAEVAATADRVRRLPATSSEKVGCLVGLSRLLLRISPDDSKELFASAVELTKEIDQEAHYQIQLLEPLTKSAAVTDPAIRRETAAGVFRFVAGAAERLSQDGFPWEVALKCLARLSLPVGLCAAARWEDQGMIGLPTTLPPLLCEALAIGELQPTVVAALAILLPEPQAPLISKILTSPAVPHQRYMIAEELARDCLLCAPPNELLRVGQTILSAIGQPGATTGPNLELLAKYTAFLEGLPAEQTQQSPPAGAVPSPNAAVQKADQVPKFTGCSFVTAQAIREALDAYGASGGGAMRIRDLLLAMRKEIPISDRIAFLQAIAQVPLDPREAWDRAHAVLDALSAWGDSPAVGAWRTGRLPDLIITRFHEFTTWLGCGGGIVADLLSATRLSARDRADVLIRGVERCGISLEGRTLYDLAERLVEDLSAQERETLLPWYVKRLADRLAPDPHLVLKLPDVPATATEALGRFLFALLSDIDSRLRWRCAHAIRRLARLHASEELDAVVLNWQRTQEACFRAPDAPFHWLAARLWLVMALDRVAGESPAEAARHAPFLAEAAFDHDLPHILIRESAKRALLRLHKGKFLQHAAVDMRQVNSVNVSRLKPTALPKESRGTSFEMWPDIPAHRFEFDWIDTLRYWYGDLLRLFPTVGKPDLLARAERWILEEWRAPPEANRWVSEPRKGRYEQRQWELWSHRHGELPTIERFGTYLEWHAMLCVAGELLRTHPLSRSEHDWLGGFAEWLDRLLPTNPDYWLSDYRQPVPMEQQFWTTPPLEDEAWLRSSPVRTVLDALGVGNPNNPDRIIIAGSHTIEFPTRVLDVHVWSAAISPESAQALLRARQTAPDPSYLSIQVEDGRREIDKAPYRLLSLLAELPTEMRFDDRDPLRHRSYPFPEGPGRRLTEFLKLVHAQTPPQRWVPKASKGPALVAETWSAVPDRRADDYLGNRDCRGWRLWIGARELLTFLKAQALDLICEVKIDKRVRSEYSRDYDTDPKKRRTFNKILLLRRDGAIQEGTRRLGTWTPDRAGPQARAKR
jgi:hypothetical protein